MPDPEQEKKLAELDSSIKITEGEEGEKPSPRSVSNQRTDLTQPAAEPSQKKTKSKAKGDGYFALLFFMFAVFSCFFSNYINLMHVGLLERLSRNSPDSVTQIYLNQDLMKAYDSLNMHANAVAVAEDLLARCSATPSLPFSLQQISYAKLLLAKSLLGSNQGPRAQQLIVASLSEITSPKHAYPDELGDLLCDLANACVQKGDRKLAAKLFKKSSDYWIKVCQEASSYSQGAASKGHKCYMLLDAAANSEEMGDIKGAAEFTRLAVESAERDEHWDKTEGQIDRLGRLAYFYNKMKMYTEAETFAKKAVAIPMEDANNPFKNYAQEQLTFAQEALAAAAHPKQAETSKGKSN
jgi:hypothetical protein